MDRKSNQDLINKCSSVIILNRFGHFIDYKSYGFGGSMMHSSTLWNTWVHNITMYNDELNTISLTMNSIVFFM